MNRETFDPQDVDCLIDKIGATPDCLISLLQAIQDQYRYLPAPVLEHLCTRTGISAATVAGVSTFYSRFRHHPAGRHMVKVCIGTACHIKGAERVYDALHRRLGCGIGEDTDAQGIFTIEKVACLGCCTLAPAVQIDTVTYGHVTPASAPDILADFLKRLSERRPDGAGAAVDPDNRSGEIRLSLGSCCVANGTALVGQSVREVIENLGISVPVKSVGCLGVCHQAPVIEIESRGNKPALYSHVSPADARRIVRHHFRPRGLTRRLRAWIDTKAEELLTDRSLPDLLRRHSPDAGDGPVDRYLGKQKHIATEHCGTLDPTDLNEYRRHGGFDALTRCLHSLTPEEVIQTVSESGLRGRGGGGFPTGVKWDHVRRNVTDTAYVVCNGDEGDPGAFMDRKLLESYPYRVIEGMMIAAYAVGAKEGFIYIRSEYPLALERVRTALKCCRDGGVIGDHAPGSTFSFSLRVMEGAGAFVCGEETALIRSLEGKRGMPRLRPPYPSQQGLWNAPTLINNCETLACVPWIIRNGSQAFRSVGTAQSPGTKVFSLAGKIRYGGLIEVPMGITMREIVEEIGGGVPPGRSFKAVQIGGPSGGCIPAHMTDLPVDFEALVDAGAMMGSGGMVVLDNRDCMVDIARYFLSFTQKESCGRCTFCRIGTRRMLDILEDLQQGRSRKGDLERLESLAAHVTGGSLCGLGKTAPNPVTTTLKYFREEYEAHLRGECPAGSCKTLISYSIDDKCTGCTICSQKCPVDAIPFTPYRRHTIDDTRCIRCDSCRTACPADAIGIVTGSKRREAPCPG